MNNSRILFSFLISFVFILVSCKDNNSTAKDAARNSLEVPETVAPVTPAIQAGGAVAHYICANNCEGSGGAAAGNCPVCGNAYVHNQAFHGQPGATNATTPPPPASAQNAAGVFHYTCSAGCAGGSGAQGNCASCGNALVHNTAYHN